MKLRKYQEECLDVINALNGGSHLVSLATGLGKTVIFSNIKRRGRVLILSHRDELVHQPEKYYDCSFGVEQANEHSQGEEVVSASVQSLVRRLDKFAPDEFDMIITDEAHHAAAPTYKKIYAHFKPRIHFGFTATPNRADKVRLDDVFDDIIFDRDLRWGIQHGFLTDINCLRVDIGFDLSKVKKRMGDYELKQLSAAVNQKRLNQGIAQAYKNYAIGQTIIFAVDVDHAYAIAREIEGAVAVTSDTPNRAEIIRKFTNREIPCIVNCMVFAEGTDLPLIETVMIARPTSNASLYTQMVGRGLRLSEGKRYLTLIDCVGVSGRNKLCTAPSLLGIDMTAIPNSKVNKVEGMLMQMERKIESILDCSPDAWILNAQKIDVFAEDNQINMHNVNWKPRYDGSFLCSLDNAQKLIIESVNELGRTSLRFESRIVSESGQKVKHIKTYIARNISIQFAFDLAWKYLEENHRDSRKLWDMNSVNQWGKNPASDSQKNLIIKLLNKPANVKKYESADYDVSKLSKYEASIIIDRLLAK